MPVWYVNPSSPKVGSRRARAMKKATSKGGKKRRKLYGAALTAKKKSLAKRKRRSAARRPTVVKEKSMAKRKRRRTKKAASRRTGKRKSAKRVRAGKKAARTRARRKGARKAARKSAPRKRRSSRKRRSAPRKRRSSRKRSRRAAPRKRRSRRRARRTISRGGWRGVKALRRARKTLKWTKRRGTRRARAYARRHRMRTNPVGGIIDAVKAALPVAASFFAGRILVASAKKRLPASILGTLGRHAGPVTSLALIALANIAARKVSFLGKHRTSINIGLGLNAVMQVLTTYNPAGVMGYIGAGDSYQEALAGPMYDSPLADYVQTSDYVQTGDYVATGAYEAVAHDGLGVAEPMAFSPAQLLMPHVESRMEIPDFEPSTDDELATGIFAR